jgi:hypothetical protein
LHLNDFVRSSDIWIRSSAQDGSMMSPEIRADLVYFGKWRLAAQVIQKIQFLQKSSYNFRPVQAIQGFFQEAPPWSFVVVVVLGD